MRLVTEEILNNTGTQYAGTISHFMWEKKRQTETDRQKWRNGEREKGKKGEGEGKGRRKNVKEIYFIQNIYLLNAL